MDTNELAWASGLFEGEGCISLTKDKRTPRVYPRLILSMTDEDVVRRFHAAVGLGNVVPWEDAAHRSPFWRWQSARFEYVQAVLAMLWSGLGDRRRARAREVLGAAMECRPKP